MLDRGLNKQQWLDLIRSERANWDRLLEEVGRDRLEQSGVVGDWSVKDLAAHIAYWEERAVLRLEAAVQGTSPQPNPYAGLSDDEHNALIYSWYKDKPLDEVLDYSRQVNNRLVAAAEQLSEEQLSDKALYPWINGRALWETVSGNSYYHYSEHEQTIREWLDKVPA